MSDRRNWTLEKEDVMISILEGVVADGGRCDTGSFRPGTYELVALKMREKIKNITITSKHVQNKIKRLKDKYSAAYDMLNTSGFGWDDTHKCVTVASEILDEYLKKHPNKNYTVNRPFRHYERLVKVFGKDRATSSMAESAPDALDNMRLETEESETAAFTQALSTPSNVTSQMLPLLPLTQIQEKHQSGREREREMSIQQQQTSPRSLKKAWKGYPRILLS
ncbi:hypothetical protein Ddye_020809 [Dipteronia dyeriana]|uniref:Myb/SANT-like domain-containing protein n=1 Tax=Dipteronia dyeriana TaxID=168575 RepID=A0AAD9WVQ5_9ROSI|nr:hypothetical protein Ddye_020809 [Dipteronia dyeriana]